MLPEAVALGTREDWRWAAFAYLQCRQCKAVNRVGPGTVEVSIAALAAILALAEDLAVKSGIIPEPDGAA